MDDWILPSEKINELQQASIAALVKRAKWAHMVDVKVRINGQDEWYQVDWLKHLKPLAAAPQQQAEPAPRPNKGDPMLDAVLKTPNAEFEAWVKSLPRAYWARYDLSACRIGWEAGRAQQQAERDALLREQQEQIALLESSGPITCRNGKPHERHDGCLYCERDALRALINEAWPYVGSNLQERIDAAMRGKEQSNG